MQLSASTFLTPYLHQFSALVQIMHFLVLFEVKKNDTITAPFIDSFWDEFSEQS